MKAYETGKHNIENVNRKEEIVKRHISQQDCEIKKLKNRASDLEKKIKSLNAEILVKIKIY